MKKIILSVVLVLVFGFANAQKAQFGIKGGLNVANQNFVGAGAPSTSTLVGVNVGLFVDIKVADKLVIQPELLYSMQGTKLNWLNDGATINSFKLAYINIPVMAKYYAAKNFSIEFGPQIGFLTSAKVNGTANGQTVDVDAKQFYNSTDFGINFGAGYDFTKKVSIGMRYNLGLSNVGSDDFVSNGDKITNSVFSISMGYKF
ncbi:MAG: PorT family protein [Flavobacterium sp.]|nr:PorT family protein [Flavobacterium sp.]